MKTILFALVVAIAVMARIPIACGSQGIPAWPAGGTNNNANGDLACNADGGCVSCIQKPAECNDCNQSPGAPVYTPSLGISYSDWLQNHAGLASWRVTEPMANLWLKDIPFIYKASRGRSVHFALFYKNLTGQEGAADSGNPAIFSVGSRWHTPWRSYIQGISGETTNFWVFHGGGTAHKYTLGVLDYQDRARLTVSGNYYVLDLPNGTRHTFGFTNTMGGTNRYFLTRREDPNGNPMQFQYVVTNNAVRLEKVLDVDNRSITFEYVSVGPYSNMITKVLGPHGLTNVLAYDASGNLTNITDVIGLQSRMVYSSTNLTTLITPYGTNIFAYYSEPGLMNAVHVNEHGIRNHLYLYYDKMDGGKVPSDYLTYRPNTTNGANFSFTNSFDAANSDKRNSFYWNPRQYENITSSVRTALGSGSFNVSNLTSSDYIRARLKHWLKSYGQTNAGRTISLRRDPSPDGTVQGLVRWYDYHNKEGGSSENEGLIPVARIYGYKLPNGEPRFTISDRNELAHMTNKIETYTGTAGACCVRTNRYLYAANNIDLVSKIQIIGSTSKLSISNIWNSFHRVTTNYDALSQATVWTYNPNQQTITKTTPGGLIVSNCYGSSGNSSNFLCEVTKPQIGWTNIMTYTGGNVQCYTDARGLCISNGWDALGRLTCVTYPDATCVINSFTNLDLIQTIGRFNWTNHYSYNGFRQRTLSIDARRGSNIFTYCNCGALDSLSDPLGKTTTFLYDQVGRRQVVVPPGSSPSTNNFDVLGRATNRIDSAGNNTTNCYNNQGLLCVSSNAVGCMRRLIHDAEDRATNVTGASGITANFVFDNLGRKLQFVNASNDVEYFGYSSLGLSGQTNHLGYSTLYGYDVAGRKIAETNANGEVILYSYSQAGDLLKVRDAKGNERSWGYDHYGRITSTTNASGLETLRYAYDPNGRLTNRWSATKGNTVYRYDAVGNLTNVSYPSGASIHYTYDANNRLTKMVDAIGTTVFAYTAFGALSSEDGPWEADTVTYYYNTNGSRIKILLQQPNGSAWEQSYDYDAAERLSATTSPAGCFSYDYDPLCKHAVRRLTLPNAAYATNGHDGLGRLTATVLRNSTNGLLDSHSYGYDAANQRISVTRRTEAIVNYTYDKGGQLIAANGFEPGGAPRLHEQLGYLYDAAGNLANQTNSQFVQTYALDSLNQLSYSTRSGKLTVAGTTTGAATNVTVNTSNAVMYSDSTFASTNHGLVDGTNTFTAVARDASGRSGTNLSSAYLQTTNWFTYDANGNMRSDGVKGFDYDDENQLIRITATNAWKSEFGYDGRMRRRVRDEYVWQSGGWTLMSRTAYVYDGALVVQERDESNLPLRTYTRGKDLSSDLQGAGGIGGLLAYSTAAPVQHAFYHADGNGNVTCLISSNQALAARYVYDPFGNVLASSGPLAEGNLYRFSSKEVHTASGVTYYLSRYYSQQLHRWLNTDPACDRGFALLRRGMALGKSRRTSFSRQDVNLTLFVENNPISLVDPLGEIPFWCPIFGGVRVCNESSHDMVVLSDGGWSTLPPGQCTSRHDDIDGFWFEGVFYAPGNLDYSTVYPGGWWWESVGPIGPAWDGQSQDGSPIDRGGGVNTPPVNPPVYPDAQHPPLPEP